MSGQILFHLLGALQFAYGCYYDHTYVRLPGTTGAGSFGGKLKFLTFIDAIIQTLYFSIALVNDVWGTNEPTPASKPLIRRLKDIIFSTLAFPVAMFVGITFWGIYAIDRELVLPQRLDVIFPTWLNHVMHTNIVAFAFIELLTSFRMYPLRKRGMSLLTAFMLCYMVWIHVVYVRTGTWVYPLLEVLNWPLRVVFYLFSLGLVLSLYLVGELMNKVVWSKEIEKTVKSGKKKAK